MEPSKAPDHIEPAEHHQVWAAYVRFEGDGVPGSSEAWAERRSAIEAWAQNRNVMLKWYEGGGYTGKGSEGRKAYLRMLADVGRANLRGIVVAHLSDLGRDFVGLMALTRDLNREDRILLSLDEDDQRISALLASGVSVPADALAAAMKDFDARVQMQNRQAGLRRYRALGGKIGRKRVPIDWAKVDPYIRAGVSSRAIAELVGLNKHTARARIRQRRAELGLVARNSPTKTHQPGASSREPWLDAVFKRAGSDKRITWEDLVDLMPYDVIRSNSRLDALAADLIRGGIMLVETRSEEPESVMQERPKTVDQQPDAPSTSTSREQTEPPLLSPGEEIRHFREMEDGYRRIASYLCGSTSMMRHLVEECWSVEEGAKSLNQVARVGFECLTDKKALWRDRQRFIRRLRDIRREAGKIESYQQREPSRRVRLNIADSKEIVFNRVQTLALQHHLIIKLVGEFRTKGMEILDLALRLQAAEAEGREDSPEVTEVRRKLRECREFLGYDTIDVPKVLAEIADCENRILVARDKLIESNMWLVTEVAKQHVNRRLGFSVLMEQGKEGLVEAVEQFSFREGSKFSTFATWWIKQAITRAIADQSRTVRVPAHIIDAINKVAKIQRQFMQKHGREATVAELAVRLSTTQEKIEALSKISQFGVSLDKPVDDDETIFTGHDEKTASHDVGVSLLGKKLEEALAVLTKREEKVLRLRFGLGDGCPRTLEEVGQIFNITRERVRQIETKALKKLRHPERLRKSEPLRGLLQ